MAIVTTTPFYWDMQNAPKPQHLIDMERKIYEGRMRLERLERDLMMQKERERKALYLIAEKLGIDINSL